MMSDKKHRVCLEVKYYVEIESTTDDEDRAIDFIDRYLEKADDYEIVNRSSTRSVEITDIKVVYPEREQWPRPKIKKKKK